MRFLDLFSGIGGFALGLQRAGMSPAMFCEIEPFCQRVLAKHWPGVPIHDDIRTLDRVVVAAQAGPVDLVCGGFPCQDISIAGQGRGLSGERSGLWFEYRRLVEEIRPRWVVIENVPALRTRGLDQVLGGLAALGYDAEWHCVPAVAVGAPHRRDRLWLVAHAHRPWQHEQTGPGNQVGFRLGHGGTAVANPVCDGQQGRQPAESAAGGRRRSAHEGGADVADADGYRGAPGALHAEQRPGGRHVGGGGVSQDVANASAPGLPLPERPTLFGARWWDEGRAASERGWWGIEPDVGRVAHGVPSRVDRLRSLGNAVVPQVVEVIGRRIMALELLG